MRPIETAPAAVLGLLLATGWALAGFFVGHALLVARASERLVTVKGLAEREVPADLVIWPIAFTATGNGLESLQRGVDESTARIRGFLEQEFPGDAVLVSTPGVVDRDAQSYAPEGRPVDRYFAQLTVTLRTGTAERVRAATERLGDLVRDGVALAGAYGAGPQYLFTGLDRIKPEMIAEATRDARRAAEKFAEDSGSRVGAIRSAQQGYFSIEDRDPFSPEYKRVRVVTTVRFFLVDD